MAILKTEQYNKVKQAADCVEGGCGMVYEFFYKPQAAQAITNGDILLMGRLPANCKVISMDVYTTAVGTGTVDVGLIKNSAMAQAFVEAVDISAERFTNTKKLGAFKYAPSDTATDVGVLFKAGLTIPANAEIRVIMRYRNTQPLE